MTTKLAKTALRNISRNKRRSVLSGVAIGVAAMAIVMLFSLIAGMQVDMESNLKSYYTGGIRIRNENYEQYERFNPVHLTVDAESVQKVLDTIEEVDVYVPRTSFPANLYIEGTNFGAMGVGADFKKEADFIDLAGSLKMGHLPENGKNEMMMGAVLARDLKLEIGDKVTIMSTTAARGTNAITLEIVGLFTFPVAALNAKYFWAPIDRISYFLRMNGDTQEVILKVKEGVSELEAAEAIKEALKKETSINYDVQAFTEISGTYEMIEMANTVYTIMAFIFFLLGSTVIINTTMMVIFERMREIGTLGALGMHGKELVRLFFLEGMFISIIGTFIGVTLGIGFTLILGKTGIDFTESMQGIDFEISGMMYPKLSISKTIFVFFYSVIVASLATLIPSRKAAKIEPVEALRYV
ncbi:MAG: ABC transporter permease [Spirochaetia bacterium]|jgi:putative ABC transport system permease protein|nr:ABC transporter permease [Spirochaetia bacterium]